MSDPNVLLREAIGLLRDRANHVTIPEARGRTKQGLPADLIIRTNIAIACGCDTDIHHGAPCIVKDREGFNASKLEGARMPAGAWDGIGHYLTSITDITRHLLDSEAPYILVRDRGLLTSDGPVFDEQGDLIIGQASIGPTWIKAITPARALLLATLLHIANERGLDVA